MIPIYNGKTGAKLSFAYNGLTFNNPDDDPLDTYKVDSVVPVTTVQMYSEPHAKGDGSEMYDVRKIALVHRVNGWVVAKTHAGLWDKIVALAAAVDPAKLSHESSDNGWKQLTFNVPTADVTNYTTGLVSSFYYARARAPFDAQSSQYFGLTCPYQIDFLSKDPARYYATQQSQTGAATVDNSLATYRSWPTLTITLSGAGAANYTITNTNTTATTSLVLDLSAGVAADVVVVDFENRTITVTGSGTATWVSGDYFYMEPLSSNAITYSNTSGVTSSVLTWYRAFSG